MNLALTAGEGQLLLRVKGWRCEYIRSVCTGSLSTPTDTSWPQQVAWTQFSSTKLMGLRYFMFFFCCEKCVISLQEMLVSDSSDCEGSYLLGIFEVLPFAHLRITFPRGCSVCAGPDTPYGLYLYFGCEYGRCCLGGRGPLCRRVYTLKPSSRLPPFLRSIRA